MKQIAISFFGSSLTSSYWNGAATYYRGIIKSLHAKGHRITFYEPDAYNRQQNRDLESHPWARVVVYPAKEFNHLLSCLEEAKQSDLIIKASGIGVFDEPLEKAVLGLQSSRTRVAFWDVDAPATLDRIEKNTQDPFRNLIPSYDFIFTYGGGNAVVKAYQRWGARVCIPVYNALDPETHHPVSAQGRYEVDLSFLGNRLPDREERVENFFIGAALRLSSHRFLLGGCGWGDKPLPSNVDYRGHIPTGEHNALNSSARAVLNINRESMSRYGFSPPTRIFEAAGAGACLITDHWDGIDMFLEPGREVLTAQSGEEVAQHIRELDPKKAHTIGIAARKRILGEHTYSHRANQLQRIFEEVL